MFVTSNAYIINNNEVPESRLDNIRNGDAKAFEEVFRQHYQSLCRYAISILKKQDESEDIVQQVFVNFWEKREKTIITGSLQSYLFRSVHNYCLNAIKHEKVKTSYQSYNLLFEMQYELTADKILQNSELENKIEMAINELPSECRKIFKMNRIEEMKYKEIAEKLGLSIKTVENQIGKALKHLRISLADYVLFLILTFFGR